MSILEENDPLWLAIDLLLESINRDNNQNGGLLSRETMALGDKLRVQVYVDREKERKERTFA